MNTETGQSEDLTGGEKPNEVVEENGVVGDASSANTGETGQQEGDAEQAGQGNEQSKSQKRKFRNGRKLRESEDRNAQLAEDNRTLREDVNTLKTQVDGVINPPEPRPSRVNFETEEEYEDSLHNWRQDNKQETQGTTGEPAGQQGNEQQSAPAAKPQVSAETQEIVDNWKDNCDVASDKYEDFEAVITSKDLDISNIMRDAMYEDKDNGAEVAYFLGKNPTEATRINGLSIVQQVAEMQKISAKFSNNTTGAPDPIEPTGGGDTPPSKDVEKMSPTEYRDHRRKQKAAR